MDCEERKSWLCEQCKSREMCGYIERGLQSKCHTVELFMYGWKLGQQDAKDSKQEEPNLSSVERNGENLKESASNGFIMLTEWEGKVAKVITPGIDVKSGWTPEGYALLQKQIMNLRELFKED